MNLLRLIPSYARMEARAIAAEANYASETRRYAEARAFDAQTVEGMRARHAQEVSRLVDLLDKERTDRQWLNDRLLESRNVRPVHDPSPRDRAEAEARKDDVPRENLGPRQRAIVLAQQEKIDRFPDVEKQVEDFKKRVIEQQTAQAKAKNGTNATTNG